MARDKISKEQRAELLRLRQEGKLAECTALALSLGVSKYYGSLLAHRARKPRLSEKWKRVKGPPVVA